VLNKVDRLAAPARVARPNGSIPGLRGGIELTATVQSNLQGRSLLSVVSPDLADRVLSAYALSVPPDSVYRDVLVHGLRSGRGFKLYVDGKMQPIPATALARAVRGHLQPGEPLRLLACYASRGGFASAAQELADLLRVEVKAYPDKMRIDWGFIRLVNGRRWVIHYPR